MPASVTVLDSSGSPQTVNTLPALGSAVMAASLPVTLASDGPMVTVSGTISDTAYTGSGNATNNALLKAIANNAVSTAASPVLLGPFINKTIAASQTLAVVGTTGAAGDYLYGLEITPATTSPGAVTVYDGSSTVVYSWPGGASSVSNLVPFGSVVAQKCANAGWHVTTGANVSVRLVGLFT